MKYLSILSFYIFAQSATTLTFEQKSIAKMYNLQIATFLLFIFVSSSTEASSKVKRSLQFDAVFFKPYFEMYGNNFEKRLFENELKRAETSRLPSDKRFKNLAMYRSLGSTKNYFEAIDNAAKKVMESIKETSSRDKEMLKLNELQRKMQAVATQRERHMKFIQRKHDREVLNPSITPEEKLKKNMNHLEQSRTHQFALAKWQNAANSIQESLLQRQRARA